MKKWFLMVISAFALMICSACCTSKKKADAKVCEVPLPEAPKVANAVKDSSSTNETKVAELPKEWVERIKGAERMEMMMCDPYSEEDNVERLFGHAEVIGRESVADTTLRARMDSLLTTAGAFHKGNVVKDCAFMPDVAVVYCGKKDTAYVMYSLYCDVVRFQTGEEYIDYDSEGIRKEFIKVAADVFKKDRFLREKRRRV